MTTNMMSPRRSRSSSPSVIFQRLFLLSTILGATMQSGVTGFAPSSLTASRSPSLLSTPRSSVASRLAARAYDDDDDDDDRDRELARVRRRRGRAYSQDEEDYEYESDNSVLDAADRLEDEGFFDDLDDYDEDFDDDDDDEFDDEFDDESRDVFSNTVIPNPILDSIDPDGSAERFPELAADPRFWFDMFLFIAFLNFISFIGPRNPFPEMIPAMKTAGLPPPGL